jgi:tail protein
MSSPLITWELDGWTGYQGHRAEPDSDGVRWHVQEVLGWWGPTGIRNNDQDKTGSDGAFYSPPDRAARVVTIIGTADCPDDAAMESAMDRFNSLLGNRSTLHTLTANELTRARQVDVHLADGTTIEPAYGGDLDYQLTVIAPDSRKFSGDLHQTSCHMTQDAPGGVRWDLAASAAGVQWDGPAGTTGLVWESGPGESGVMQLTNSGTADAPIRFTVAGPVQGPSIVDVQTDRTIAYPGLVADGSQLVIDTGTGYTALDGANRRPQLTRTDFFSIPANGSVTVAFRGALSSTTALLIAQWRDAWI